jgi:hypothetical protein
VIGTRLHDIELTWIAVGHLIEFEAAAVPPRARSTPLAGMDPVGQPRL